MIARHLDNGFDAITRQQRITGRKTVAESKGGCLPMDNTTSALTTGLQKYFTLCNANVNRQTERSNSLNVNPIKNLWPIINRRVEKRRPTDREQSSYSAMLNIPEPVPPPESVPSIPESALSIPEFRPIPEL
ncbi:unnamed protein product [Rotaria magnacalcarata]|uniref:Uncharacterized protein n=1 Tax=Rotaria magnacalcarata TaxID=392030 RepID=A0A816H1U7_9BILA|nr:unnamed protein product [Rotaria magnacalcarata]CAF1680286.1 unnamed protein product [Rotaria magnacalcarata]CAF4103343.1 unnamed protein product [Rotaria magnacalcarata]CAF4603440.1 unnamed protein product [Rotaria magnacalcarata]